MVGLVGAISVRLRYIMHGGVGEARKRNLAFEARLKHTT